MIPELKVIVEERNKMKDAIATAIADFMDNTGLQVSGIKINMIDVSNLDYKRFLIGRINFDIEIP